MISREFTPQISDGSIRLALVTAPGHEYPEIVLQDLKELESHNNRNKRLATIVISLIVLLSGVSLIVSLIKPDFLSRERLLCGSVFLIGLGILVVLNRKSTGGIPQTLEKTVENFYFSIIGPVFQRYLLLAPATMERCSEAEFNDIWKNLEDALIQSVKHQDSASCTRCNKESRGLWLPEKLWIKGDIPNAARLFFECSGCKQVYCIECFNDFPNKRQCPNCGTKLQQVSEGLENFMEESVIKIGIPIINLQIDQKDDRIADVVCELQFQATYKRLSPPATVFGAPVEDEYLNLGEKGKINYRFHNKAVKIGENWRMISADPCQ